MRTMLLMLCLTSGIAVADHREAPKVQSRVEQPAQLVDIPDELVLGPSSDNTVEMKTPSCKSMMNYCRAKTPNDCNKNEHCVIDGKHHGSGPWVGTCQCK